MLQPTCSNCRWESEGHCLYNPPVVQLIMAQTIQGPQPQPVSVHPPVRPTNFCSKHDPRTGTAAEVLDV